MEFKGIEKTQKNKRLFLTYYIYSGENIALAARNANISRQHVYSWLKEDLAFRQAKEQIDYGTVSFVLSMLLEKAKAGNMKALLVLKSRAEKRIKTQLRR